MNKKKLIGWILVFASVMPVFAALYMIGGWEPILVFLSIITFGAILIKGCLLISE